jgi:hypothetical protein
MSSRLGTVTFGARAFRGFLAFYFATPFSLATVLCAYSITRGTNIRKSEVLVVLVSHIQAYIASRHLLCGMCSDL